MKHLSFLEREEGCRYARVGCGDERAVGDFRTSEGEREDASAMVGLAP